MKFQLFSKGSLCDWLDGRVGPARGKIATYKAKSVCTASARADVDRALIERQKVCPIGHQFAGWMSVTVKKPSPGGWYVSIPFKGRREIFEMRLPDDDLPPLPGKLENGTIEVFLAGETHTEIQASLEAWIQLLDRYIARANQLISEHNTKLVGVLQETLKQRHEAVASLARGYHHGPRR